MRVGMADQRDYGPKVGMKQFLGYGASSLTAITTCREKSMKGVRRALIFCLVSSFLWSCSDDPKRNPNNIVKDPPRDTGASDMHSDMGDASGAPDMNSLPDVGPDAAPDQGCVPETDEEMCLRYDYECGPLQDLDNCGVERTIDSCGDGATVCMDFDSCGAGGIPGQCGCTIATCESLGVLCGEVDDTCGGTLDCNQFCADEITAGGQHACAIGSGKIKCWGSGSGGQLGTGGSGTEKNPVDVMGLTTTVAHAAAGGSHTCVIDSSGQVICWGKNDRGQLGIGTTVSTDLPGSAAIGADADQIDAGEVHTCARSGGKVECWGSNDYGQVGDSSFNIGANVGVPTVPDGLETGVTTVAIGQHHNCVLQDDADTGASNVLKCWGRNRFAQAGSLPTNVDSNFGYVTPPGHDLSTLISSPRTIDDPNDPGQPWSGLKAVSVGGRHTCAIDGNDQLWCWGFIPGFNPDTDCPKPYTKTASECSVFPRDTGIAVGKATTDFSELSSVDAVWVANSPVQMELDGKIPTSVASGEDHSCILVSNPDPGMGNILCYGRSQFGQIGDGTNNHWPQPRQVISDANGELVTGTQLDLGYRYSCALADDRNVKCWGSNASSQIGNSDLQRDESYRPFDVRLAVAP